MSRALAGKTIVMSGGSRGIGLAIAERAAADGANVVLLAKSDQPDPRLAGTIHTAATQIESAGGRAVAIVGDVRDDEAIARAVTAAVTTFGGIDICVNNASVLSFAGTAELTPKRYDLMQDVNTRGTYMLSRACLPFLLEADNPHILTLSPPINVTSHYWLGRFPGYLLSKYGMTLATLALAAEFSDQGIAANSLWPRTTIATDAVKNLMGGRDALAGSRTPAIVADAAYEIFTRPAREFSGRTLIDEDVLMDAGVADLDRYSTVPGTTRFDADFFLEEPIND